jgi:hypothetical protein
MVACSCRATARRNVTQRIARLIEALERAPRKPDAWECEHVQRTQAALNELDYPCDDAGGERRSPGDADRSRQQLQSRCM